MVRIACILWIITVFSSCYQSSQDTWLYDIVNAEKSRFIEEQNKIQKLIDSLGYDDSVKDQLIRYGKAAHSLLVTNIKIADTKIAVKCMNILEVTGDASIGDKVVDLLMTHYSADIRLRAARFLGGLEDKFYYPHLEKGLSSEKFSMVIEEIVKAMGKLKDKRALDRLLPMLKPGDPIAPYAAASLGEIGNGDCVHNLISFFNSGNIQDRIESALALGKIGGKDSVDHLRIGVKKENDDRVREACARGLGLARDKTAILELISALDDKSDLVFFSANNSLQRITGVTCQVVGDTISQTRELTIKFWRDWSNQHR